MAALKIFLIKTDFTSYFMFNYLSYLILLKDYILNFKDSPLK